MNIALLAFSRDAEMAVVGWTGVIIGVAICLLVMAVMRFSKRLTAKQQLDREFKNGYRRIARAVDMLAFEARTASKYLREILTIARGLQGTEYSGGVAVQLEAIVRKYKPVFERRRIEAYEKLRALRQPREILTDDLWCEDVVDVALDLRGIDKALIVFGEIEKLYVVVQATVVTS